MTTYPLDHKCERECEGITRDEEDYVFETRPFTPKRENILSSQIDADPNPVPYTFRVATPIIRRGIAPQPVKAPPFYLQLDHTLAVLWCLFRKKAEKAEEGECELGVSQLQWALYFLKGIKYPNGGDRAQDVTIAIKAVEDALLDLYVDLCNVVMQTPQQEVAGGVPPSTYMESSTTIQPCATCETARIKKIIPSSWIPDAATTPCSKCSSITLGTHKGEGRPRKTEKVTSASSSKAIVMKSPLSSGLIEWEEQPGTPFRGPPTIAIPHMCKRNVELTDEIFNLKKTAIELAQRLQQPLDENEAEENAEQTKVQLNMLMEWRKEQVCRVQSELRRLRSLDSALGVNSDITEVSISNYTIDNSGTQSGRHSKSNFEPQANSTAK